MHTVNVKFPNGQVRTITADSWENLSEEVLDEVYRQELWQECRFWAALLGLLIIGYAVLECLL